MIGFRKYFHFLLSRRLRKQVISLASHSQYEVGRKLVGSDVIVQNFRVELTEASANSSRQSDSALSCELEFHRAHSISNAQANPNARSFLKYTATG